MSRPPIRQIPLHRVFEIARAADDAKLDTVNDRFLQLLDRARNLDVLTAVETDTPVPHVAATIRGHLRHITDLQVPPFPVAAPFPILTGDWAGLPAQAGPVRDRDSLTVAETIEAEWAWPDWPRLWLHRTTERSLQVGEIVAGNHTRKNPVRIYTNRGSAKHQQRWEYKSGPAATRDGWQLHAPSRPSRELHPPATTISTEVL